MPQENDNAMEPAGDDVLDVISELSEDGAPPAVEQPGAKQKRKFGPMKSNWVFMYWANGTRITAEMLKSYGGLDADECHSTEDSATVYVYVHLLKQVRQIAIDRFFANTRADYNFRLHDVRDEGAIASDGRKDGVKLQDHIGFKMLVRHMNENNPKFQACTCGKALVVRGLLYRMRVGVNKEADDARTLANTRVTKRMQKVEEDLSKERKDRVKLLEENRALGVALEAKVLELAVAWVRQATSNAELAGVSAGLKVASTELALVAGELLGTHEALGALRAEDEALKAALDAKAVEVAALRLACDDKDRALAAARQDGDLGALRLACDDKDRALEAALVENRRLVAENGAVLGHAAELDERISVLEAAQILDTNMRRRVRSELEDERNKVVKLGTTIALAAQPVLADKRKLADENLALRAQMQSLEREVKRLRAGGV